MTGISSSRLDLIPMTPEFLRASITGDRAGAGAAIGLSLPPEWPDLPDVLRLRLRQLEQEPALLPWLLRAIALRDTRTMVGHIGFHTAPGAEYLRPWCPDGIEFGFTVFAPYRRRGYAREAAQTLIEWARQQHGVTQFVASIAPDNLPSQALAAGLGFVRVGEHLDETDGLEDVLVLDVAGKRGNCVTTG